MNKISIFSTGLLCFALFFSCVKDSGKPTPTVVVTVGFCDTITFSKHIKPIINSNCAISGCHVSGGTGDGNFETYDGIKAKVDDGSIKDRAFEAKPPGPMPATGLLPQAQLSIIKCWMDKGAKND